MLCIALRSRTKSESVKSLKREPQTGNEIVSDDLSSAERTLKRQRLITEESWDDFLNSKF